MRLPEGYEIYGLLRMLGRFAERRRDGRGLHSDEIQRLEPMLTDELVQQMLGELCEIGLLRRAESGDEGNEEARSHAVMVRRPRAAESPHRPTRGSVSVVERECCRRRTVDLLAETGRLDDGHCGSQPQRQPDQPPGVSHAQRRGQPALTELLDGVHRVVVGHPAGVPLEVDHGDDVLRSGLTVHGLDTAQVGRIAARAGIALTSLQRRGPALE